MVQSIRCLELLEIRGHATHVLNEFSAFFCFFNGSFQQRFGWFEALGLPRKTSCTFKCARDEQVPLKLLDFYLFEVASTVSVNQRATYKYRKRSRIPQLGNPINVIIYSIPTRKILLLHFSGKKRNARWQMSLISVSTCLGSVTSGCW